MSLPWLLTSQGKYDRGETFSLENRDNCKNIYHTKIIMKHSKL